MLFTTAQKNETKCKVVNGTKLLHDLYADNCKILMKESNKDVNRWKDILHFMDSQIHVFVSWETQQGKDLNLSKLLYRF